MNINLLQVYRQILLVFACFFAVFFNNHTVAQAIRVDVTWAKPQNLTVKSILLEVPVTSTSEFEDEFPVFSYQQKHPPGNYQVTVLGIESVQAEEFEKKYFTNLHSILPVAPQIEAKVSQAKNESYLNAKCFPFFLQNGILNKITSFQLQVISEGATTQSFFQKSYVANSVLNSGNWYKIAVSSDGVYKLDKQFFKTMGVLEIDSLNPETINLYGNADGILPESNAVSIKDDLTKNAIQFVGNADTLFDDNEYFLFFGRGPNVWKNTPGTEDFTREMHIYSKVNHYFVRIDASDAPLRIQSVNESPLPHTHVVNSYSYYDIHENETSNLVQGGQRWYGELFDATLSQDFSFSIPSIDGSTPIRVSHAAAASGTGNFTVTQNGTLINTLSITNPPYDYTRASSNFSANPTTVSPVKLNYTFNRANASIHAYLDYIQINCRRNLTMVGNRTLFRDLNSVGVGNVSLFQISNAGIKHRIWDVSNKTNPLQINGSLTGNVYAFKQPTDTLREFIIFDTIFLVPTFVKLVNNQNLHALGQTEYVIVAPAQFIPEATRLGNLHQNTGLNTVVVDVEHIYNEFSSGNQDATAIKRFMKMFYDRANGDVTLQPKYLCLFGDATYDPKDRVANNNYIIPTYEFLNSEDHIAALVSDDYFGMLDNNESIAGGDLMDIGVGRLLITTATHAKTQVDKIEHYIKNGINSPLVSDDPNSCCIDEFATMFGDWRQIYTNITDDEDGATFITSDAEPGFAQVQSIANEMNCEKIYLDAYKQTSTAGGQRYPDAVNAINDRIARGSLITNYIGHGSPYGAALERVITIPQSNEWTNINRLGLFVSATCDFTKFDDPSKQSVGELISLNPKGGAIAMMTTTRAVYVSINTIVVQSLFSHIMQRDANFDALTFGEIMRRTKNTSGTSHNRRCFNLIGDPALKIALPKWRIVTDSINHLAVNASVDTVRALTKMHVVGHIEDYNGNKLTNFNGVLSPTILDKPKTVQTLGNDPNSPVVSFKTQKSALYKGRATVKNGDFKFEFIVPKDIDFNYGRGKISYYANNTLVDADGWDTTFIVGGINPNPPVDNVGPDLKIYLNDDSFVSGSIASANPLLVVEAFDDFGINTVGNGIGHDITAVLDGNTGAPIILNEYYKSNLDSYQSGKVQYSFRNLAVGPHTLDVKVWDVNNNSSSIRIEFTVVDNEEVELDHVLNYPNPFTTRTMFMFEHNQSCSHLETQVQIYTVSGRLVKTINKLVATNGFRVEGIEWDGRDDFGDQLARGVYVYRLSVTMPDGKKANKLEKLVLLK